MADKQDKLILGNIDSIRDWGHAEDFVYAQWLMLQQKQAKDYVIATGETHTVKEFVEKSFAVVGVDIAWKGKGVDEKGYCKKTNKILVEISPKYFRPTEVDLLHGDPTMAEKELGWKRKVSFEELVKRMVISDCAELGIKL